MQAADILKQNHFSDEPSIFTPNCQARVQVQGQSQISKRPGPGASSHT